MIGRGKHAKLWAKTRSQWLKDNPANHQGYYECYLCHRWIDESEITIDHVIPRSRRPDLRYDMENLKPCCYVCNSKKGSKVYAQDS